MATLNGILMSNKMPGREYKRRLQEGELKDLRRQIETRLGAIPEWADERFYQRPTEHLEVLSVHLLDAATLDELLH